MKEKKCKFSRDGECQFIKRIFSYTFCSGDKEEINSCPIWKDSKLRG